MQLSLPLLLVTATGAAAHYNFPKAGSGSAWQYVRTAANYQNNGPVTNVNSVDIRCFQLTQGGGGKTQTLPVQAGSSLAWSANQAVFHPGPLSAYMAKVPAGQTATSWDGSGAVWFKVYQEPTSSNGGQLAWASLNKVNFNLPVPGCIANGEYLYRIEHNGLHAASNVGGAQFYIACAQINVSGGSGAKTPSNLVAFPGAYKATDPGIQVNIYSARSYTPAGPPVFSC